MSTSLTLPEEINQALRHPTQGVVGVVDDLLRLCPAPGLRLEWDSGQARVQPTGSKPGAAIVVPLRESVFRAVLARLAALCIERGSTEMSPYGGKGNLRTVAQPIREFQIEFVNTRAACNCELTPVIAESASPRRPTIDPGLVSSFGGSNALPGGSPLIPHPVAARLNAWADPKPSRASVRIRGSTRSADKSKDADLGKPSIWILADSRAGKDRSITLPPVVLARCYDNPVSERVQMTLEFARVPGGAWTATLRMLPGPNHSTVTATIFLPDRQRRTFVLPAVAPGETRESVSEPSDPLEPGAVPTSGTQWSLAIEFRVDPFAPALGE
jgi:hypothetical protein